MGVIWLWWRGFDIGVTLYGQSLFSIREESSIKEAAHILVLQLSLPLRHRDRLVGSSRESQSGMAALYCTSFEAVSNQETADTRFASR